MNWEEIIKIEQNKPYYQKMSNFLEQEYQDKIIFPSKENIFRCFKLCPYDKLKVLIIGQDPYYKKGQANGLAFSVSKGIKLPPSLKNIYQELHDDLGCQIAKHGELEKWAAQGVLLMNTCLSVEENKPLSHNKIGWDQFTLAIIKQVNLIDRPLVIVLWGNNALKYERYLNNDKHLIIKSAHPSPLSCYRGFFGSRPFSKINNYLITNKLEPIDWQIEE